MRQTKQEWIVVEPESGMPLSEFLHGKLGGSKKGIKRLLDDNRCFVNGRAVRFASFLLGNGDRVALELEKEPKTQVNFDPSRVLYEDDALLIYNKPSGVNCESPLFIKALQRDLPYLALAHRLDRDTSGVLLMVKDLASEKNMREAFEKHAVTKSYLAIIDGILEHSSGHIKNKLGEIRRIQGQIYWGVTNAGRIAITDWKCLAYGKNASLVRCFPKTGRTHQLRVHMNGMGHPILGDFHYGKSFKCKYRSPYHLLHAESVRFPHPKTREIVTITAALPSHFEKAITELFGVIT